jgi:alpha-amylase
VDVADVTTDKYYEISTSKDGDKYKVNDVTSTYATAIRQVIIENSELREVKVYTLDGRLVRSVQNGTDAINGLKKGVYIVNGKKVVVK